MFCPKCGNQLPDGSRFCTNCGTKFGGAAAPRQPFKRPSYRELVSLSFMTVLFVLCMVPTLNATYSISLLATWAFDIHALLGVGKIFVMLSMLFYLCALVLNFMDLGLPTGLRKLAPLGFYGLWLFGQLFVFIGCLIQNGIIMGSAWYISLAFVIFALLFELMPKLFKTEN